MTKIPESPPAEDAFMDALVQQGDHEPLLDAVRKISNPEVGPVDAKGRYLHWDKVKHLEPPEGYTPELYWFSMKSSRAALRRAVPFVDKDHNSFWFCMPDPLLQKVLWITEQASGALTGEPTLTDEKSKKQYIINSLIDEAIYSSQLEGASTTRAVAREMIRTERRPVGVHEQMIFNNYRAMLFIRDHVEDDITPAMIFSLHKILVEGTDIPVDRIGAFRESGDNIVIEDHMTGELVHVPPLVDELKWRLVWLCNFINGGISAASAGDRDGEKTFLPPVLRAIIAHFVVGYDHPFYDGNGRTARALFYWVMAREGFWLMEHLSISGEIKKAPGTYSKAYLHTETDEGDVTYFLIHQLEVITRAIETLKARLKAKHAELRETEQLLASSPLAGKLNHRQLALIQNALKNPGQRYTVKSHMNSHRVARQTARTDLQGLAGDYDLLLSSKVGRTETFTAPTDILARIKRANDANQGYPGF